jgi:hypothetical protein
MITKTLEQVYRGYEIFECYDDENYSTWYEVPKLKFQHPITSVSNAQMYIGDELETAE